MGKGNALGTGLGLFEESIIDIQINLAFSLRCLRFWRLINFIKLN